MARHRLVTRIAARRRALLPLALLVVAGLWGRCSPPTAPWQAPAAPPPAPPTAPTISCVPLAPAPGTVVTCGVVIAGQWQGQIAARYVWTPQRDSTGAVALFAAPPVGDTLRITAAGQWVGRDSAGPASAPVVVSTAPVAPSLVWPATGPCVPARSGCLRVAAPPSRNVDARPRLQELLDSLSTVGTPHTLQLADGWFSLSATPPERWVLLQLRSRVTLSGTRVGGALATHLGPLSTVGPYRAVLGSDGRFSAAPLVRAGLEDLILEQDPRDNPTVLITPTNRGMHAKGIALFAGEDFRVERVLFRMGGIHAVKISGPFRGVVLRQNQVQFHRAPTTVADTLFYDHVGFYLDGRDMLVEDNVFEAPIAGRARTAIETHAYPAIIRRNTIRGWRTGITQTTTTQPAQAGDSVVLIRDNVIEDAVQGIRFWPITGERIAGVWITHNTITIAPWLQRLGTPAGFNVVGATSASANADGHLERVRFVHNTITVRPATGGEPAIPTPAYTALINLVASGSITDLQIRDNTIVGGFTPWIRLGMPSTRGLLDEVLITDNHVSWAAPTGPQQSDARTLIDLQGRLGRVRILDNTFDLGPEQRWDCAGWTGIRLRASETRDVQVFGQRLLPSPPIGCYSVRREAGSLLTDWP